jgi:tRNA G18 (ribose-2'-O)-methylase SpoU
MINELKVCLVAVDVRSTHNIGSFFRTCDGFGAELYIVGASPRPHYEDDTRLPHIAKKAHKEIAKTALGAENSVRWRYAETLLECVHILRKEGYSIFAVEQSSKSKPLQKLEKRSSRALVVGREVEGLDGVELSLCDAIFEIKMSGKKESFNVSVAAGIALYEATR